MSPRDVLNNIDFHDSFRLQYMRHAYSTQKPSPQREQIYSYEQLGSFTRDKNSILPMFPRRIRSLIYHVYVIHSCVIVLPKFKFKVLSWSTCFCLNRNKGLRVF